MASKVETNKEILDRLNDYVEERGSDAGAPGNIGSTGD